MSLAILAVTSIRQSLKVPNHFVETSLMKMQGSEIQPKILCYTYYNTSEQKNSVNV